MKKYAVGSLNFFDNELKIEIVETDSWKEALSKHSDFGDVSWLADDMETAKADAFDGDYAFDVVELE